MQVHITNEAAVLLLKQEPVLPDAKSVLSTIALGYAVFKESVHFTINGSEYTGTERMGHGESFLRTWS